MEMPTLIVYDGVCGLCDRLVTFLLRHDRNDRLRFTALQGPIAMRELPFLGVDPSHLDTVVAIAGWGTSEPVVLTRSRAVLHAATQLGPPWSFVSRIGLIIPRALADRLYDGIARVRYRLFGRFDSCPLPRPEWRHKFI